MSRSDSSLPKVVPQADAVHELATLLQLARRIRDARDAAALGFVAVNESRQLFPYRQAVLGRANPLGALLPAEIMSVSGLPQADPHAPYVQWLAQLFRHVAAQHETASRTLAAADLPEALAADWSTWLPAHGLLLPLPSADGKPLAYLLLAREPAWDQHELGLAQEFAHVCGHALTRFITISWRAKMQQWLRSTRRRWTLAGAIAAVALCPVPTSVLAPAEVVPREPFLVRAPLDGVVDRFHIRPNQIVKAGQPLFDLDTTALRSRLGVTRKSYDIAAEEYRQAAQVALSDEKGKHEVMLKKGQMEEKAVEMNYSQELLERVQVKAQRDGVAVFADVNDWQGKAVAIGERVLTLADPTKIELAISLPVADAVQLPANAAITLYPNGSVFDSFDAKLTNASYHAEPTPDGILAYRLKADFGSGHALPRLGQMGMAKIRTGWAPLAIHLLRRPLTAARQWLGW